METLGWLLDARLDVGGSAVPWREVIGNVFGLASTLLGMGRRVWAWPVGMAGNALPFTGFLGGVFALLTTYGMARGYVEAIA